MGTDRAGDMGLETRPDSGHAYVMSTTHDQDLPARTPPLRRTLRDSLIEAEQLRYPVRLRTTGGRSFTGVLTEVGVDFAEIQTGAGPIDVALFYIESVGLHETAGQA